MNPPFKKQLYYPCIASYYYFFFSFLFIPSSGLFAFWVLIESLAVIL